MRFTDRLASVLLGREITPEGFTGTLEPEERVLADARTRAGDVVLATDRGLWFGDRRAPWHLVSKATWANGALTVVEATESARHGSVVVLRDAAPVRLPLPDPGRVPETVHRRVTAVITTRQHHDLPSGGAWFVQRRTPEGIEVHVRPDPGTDTDEVLTLAEGIAEKLG
ncbi:hypothetical protein [Actinomycetospora sp. NBRC 106378]|uniref:hypothetical protein n=1 Tax=Actinomycetospora sp. NBRC 106378 TaxID=3032208 RepID=UPI0024A50335|nr:hypothetical protein [Actinomycetospora sp. NBRC 106378]GLZ51469.1 hypothetical protein Acsp07_10860 [Actinomycetospora sp. NBRC 106378]